MIKKFVIKKHEVTAFVKKYIDSWRFWITMLCIGLAIMGYLVFNLTQKQNREIAARITAAAIADNNQRLRERDVAVAQVLACFTQVKNQPVVDGFIDTQYALVRNNILSTQAAINISAKGDPLLPIRRASLARLKAARRSINQLNVLLTKSKRTTKDCIELARKSHVPYKQYLKLSTKEGQ